MTAEMKASGLNASACNKDSLRSYFQCERDRFSDEQVAVQPGLVSQLKAHLNSVLPKSGFIASYRALGSEVNLDQFMQQNTQLRWCFPRVHGDDIEFYSTQTWNEFSPSHWGILEPNPHTSQSHKVSDCSAVLVPAIAYDQKGHRLGYGKGFYDRALEGYQGLKIGIAYSVQISKEEFSAKDHDVPMDYVVTEKGIIQH